MIKIEFSKKILEIKLFIQDLDSTWIFSNFLFKRDAFYDMLWQWEKNHKFENWSFAEQFTEKIKTLVSFKDNMTNFLQFVKLFQEQLVLVIDIFIKEQSFLVLFLYLFNGFEFTLH
jgi:hypothetical protein